MKISRKVISFIVASSTLIVSTLVNAQGVSGPVETVWQHYFNSIFLFRVTPLSITSPALACNTTGRFAVDTSTAQGKAIVATVLAAKARDASVFVEGANVCSVHEDAETPSYIRSQ